MKSTSMQSCNLSMQGRWMLRYTLLSMGLCGSLTFALPSQGKTPPKPAEHPNILFIIMDDVGIDQVAHLLDYDTLNQPQTPTIDQLAKAGVNFGNAWAMPACSTSRAVFFTGRFPLRTRVFGALGENDLANSMVSQFEKTAPKLLANRGYQSALFGKFHITLPGYDPAGVLAPYNLGWNYFAGWMDKTGDPSSIDKTAGGVATDGTEYSCGFVPSSRAGGADRGACYLSNGSCSELATDGGVPPGRTCRDQGGILVPNLGCGEQVPTQSQFSSLLNSHFVSPVVYNFPDGTKEVLSYADPRARTFRADFAVDEAIAWINARPTNQPWMATVSFASDHTPLVQPPADETQGVEAHISDLDCANVHDQRQISDMMIESLDAQVARLLEQIGLAKQNGNGKLNYKPEKTNTMVILLGDNGSLAQTVKEPPFDASRAKGTPYQTGAWVPLIITGPLVKSPNRIVTQIVNIADLFSLFGEIAGIEDIRKEVAPRLLDAKPMLPYLTNPKQRSIRQWNFTQIGVNLQKGGATNPPCTISKSCTQIPVSNSVCVDNGGLWWGPADPTLPPSTDINKDIGNGFTNCCQVNEYVVNNKLHEAYGILAPKSVAIRNDRYKLVRNTYIPYIEGEACPTEEETFEEFYAIDEKAPDPTLDKKGTNFNIDRLKGEKKLHYKVLSKRLDSIMSSEPSCAGDGNGDLVVDQKDIDDYQKFVDGGGGSSVYDFNLDGMTNSDDEQVIVMNLNTDCRPDRR